MATILIDGQPPRHIDLRSPPGDRHAAEARALSDAADLLAAARDWLDGILDPLPGTPAWGWRIDLSLQVLDDGRTPYVQALAWPLDRARQIVDSTNCVSLDAPDVEDLKRQGPQTAAQGERVLQRFHEAQPEALHARD